MTSFYDQVGGRATFALLADRFYQAVADDAVLRPMYPDDDLGPARERLQLFLEQYWGGPTTYSNRRGHPRLRMRHAAFAVTPTAAEHWLAAMRFAVGGLDLDDEHRTHLWDYLERAAHAMVNDDDPPAPAENARPRTRIPLRPNQERTDDR